MKRRQFLTATAITAATPLLQAAGSPTAPSPDDLIDTNVYLSSWPVRRSWAASPARLLSKLRVHGVASAWVGDFDAVLQTDTAGVNARLAETCAREGGGILLPIGTVNPTLPDWEEPPVHVDLVMLDATVRAGEALLIDQGFLCALRDPEVIALAAVYGDPVELLEAGVD